MKKILSMLTTLAIVHVAIESHSQGWGSHLLISAKLDGAHEVPSVNTEGVGIAGLTLNATRDTLFVNISVNGFDSPITGIHLHKGAEGNNGPIVLHLTPYLQGSRVNTYFSGTALPDTLISHLLGGGYYVNVHTEDHPGGEIRGQLSLEKDWGFTANLNGAQEVPAVTTDAIGQGMFKLSKDKSKLIVHVLAHGLSGKIISAHFHKGSVGVAGPIVKDLTPFISGKAIDTEVDSSGILNDLLSGNLYVNLHTDSNKTGEIRGQLVPDSRNLIFDAKADAGQEAPAVDAPAKGLITVKLAPGLDSIWYDALFTDLSGPINAAHFHKAAPGVSGGIIIHLTSGISGNKVSGVVTGAGVNTTFINDLLHGDIYINAHTTAHPSGEVRGQLWRQARIGFPVSLDGKQETPPNESKGSGTGIVSIDKDGTNLYYGVVVSGLSDTLTGAHFHFGLPGQPGPIIHHLTSQFVKKDTIDHAFGFIQANDIAPLNGLTKANVMGFLKDSVYINLHNHNYPNGEIRGQVSKPSEEGIVLDVNNAASNASATMLLSPNPAADKVNITLSSAFQGSATIIVSNMMGQEVYSAPVAFAGVSQSFEVDLQHLPNGIYAVKLENGNFKEVSRIVKN
jgi:hypothetical protein